MSATFPLKSQLLRAFASVGALSVIIGGFFIPTHQALADDESPRISLGTVEGRVGKAVFNDFDDDHTSMKLKKEWVYTVNDPGSRYHGRTIRIGSVTTAWYGVIPGISDYNASDSRQVSVPWSAGYTPKWIDTSTAAAGYWSYVTRGVPEDTTQTRYKWYQPDGPTNIEVKTLLRLVSVPTIRGRSRPEHRSCLEPFVTITSPSVGEASGFTPRLI